MVKPDFYDLFHCIADKCTFTCCQEWKIAVDENTNRKWKKMLPPEGTKTRRKNLSLFTAFKDGSRVIALNDEHKCPFLNDQKLCRLVICYGEESISQTCHVFPREIHDFGTHREATLMPCCPAVIDLLNEGEAFTLQSDKEEIPDHRLFEIRALFMDIIQNPDYRIEEEMLAVFFLAQNFLEQEKLEVRTAKEQLADILEMIHGMNPNRREHLSECGELFLDLVENYRKEQLYRGYLENAVKAAEEADEKDYIEGDSIWEACRGKFDALFRKYLAQEFYADLLLPEGDTEEMVVKLEWIAMEYVQIRQLCRLACMQNRKVEYEELRDYIVLVSRMMGYEEADIYEYMENSFEDILWDMGYMVLIMGV